MSANILMECLTGVSRRQKDLAIVCQSCARTRVYGPDELFSHFSLRGISTQLQSVARRMRCRCGSIEVRLIVASREQRTRFAPRSRIPSPIYILPPGPAQRELNAPEKMLADAEREGSATLPAAMRMSDARQRVEAARRALQNVIRRKLDI